MDLAHTTKGSIKHHQTSPDMEPPREMKERTTKEYLGKSPPGRHQEYGPHLEPARCKGTGQRVDNLAEEKGLNNYGRACNVIVGIEAEILIYHTLKIAFNKIAFNI